MPAHAAFAGVARVNVDYCCAQRYEDFAPAAVLALAGAARYELSPVDGQRLAWRLLENRLPGRQAAMISIAACCAAAIKLDVIAILTLAATMADSSKVKYAPLRVIGGC